MKKDLSVDLKCLFHLSYLSSTDKAEYCLVIKRANKNQIISIEYTLPSENGTFLFSKLSWLNLLNDNQGEQLGYFYFSRQLFKFIPNRSFRL